MDETEVHTQTHATEHARVHMSIENKDWKFYVLLSLVYLAIALVAFASVTINMGSTTTGVGGDTYLNLWDIWWVNYATFTLHASIWTNLMVFWPVGENLVFHTLAPLSGLLAFPFTFISLPFAYDSVFFIGFMLSGLTMYILADYFLKNKYASFIAGLVFSFSAPHIDHALGLLIFTQVEWIPLALYFFIRMVKEKKMIYAAGLGISVMLATFMGNIEQTIMIGILLFVMFIIYLINRETRQQLLSTGFAVNVVVALVICFITGIWGFLPLINTVLQPGTFSLANNNNTAQYNMLWSADLLTFFIPSYFNSIFYPFLANSSLYLPDPSEKIAYIGYVVIALSLIALLKNFKSTRPWLAIAVVFGLMSLGPSILVNNVSTGIPTFYNLYHAIPDINVIREPERFAIITSIAFAMLAGLGAKYIFEKESITIAKLEKRKFNILATAIIGILYLIEVNGLVLAGPVTAATTTQIVNPQIYTDLAGVKGNFSTFTIPALPGAGTQPDLYPGMATYYQTISHVPIVGGLDGRQNETQLLTLYNMPLTIVAQQLELNITPNYQSPVLQNYSNQTILALYNYNTAFVILDKRAYSPGALNILGTYLQTLFGAPVYNDNTTTAFTTSNSFSKVYEKGYVAYPALSDWQQANLFLNGTTRSMWVPIQPGVINVYAPYVNQTARQQGLHYGTVYFINTSIGFQGIASSGTAQLLIGELTQSGAVDQIAEVNLTNALHNYAVDTELPSGPAGSTLFFLIRNTTSSAFSQGTVALNNITFSYAGR